MTDLVNDIAFIARGIDKLKQIDKSIVEHAAEGMKFKELLSIAADKFDDAESVLDMIARLDACNGSGVFGGSGLHAMRSMMNLLKAMSSTSLSADISALLSGNVSGLLKDAAGALLGSSALNLVRAVQQAISALGSVQAGLSISVGNISQLAALVNKINLSAQSIEEALESLSGDLLQALSAALCGSSCGPTDGSGLPGSPLAALAALAGLNITQLTGISDLATMFSQIAGAAASIQGGNNFNGFAQQCMSNLMDSVLGKNNPCKLLGLAISILNEMAGEDAYVGDKTFSINVKINPGLNSFSTAMKLIELLKRLAGAITAASHAARVGRYLAQAMTCSGYAPFVSAPISTVPHNPIIKGTQGGPGGLGGDVGGQSGIDIIANSTPVTATAVAAEGVLYANTYYSNAMSVLPTNVMRNNQLNLAANNLVQVPVNFSAVNSVALTSNIGIAQYVISGNSSVSTNIPRKNR